MNEIVAKRACIFSLILGAIIGLISLIPQAIGAMLFVLSFLSSAIVIFYMKKNEKHLGFLTNEQGAILGGLIGFFSGAGFFASFCPMVCILHLIFKGYYSYAIPYMLNDAMWLFFVVVLMVCFIFALTNAASGMGIAYVLNYFEKKPDNHDAPLDIKIED